MPKYGTQSVSQPLKIYFLLTVLCENFLFRQLAKLINGHVNLIPFDDRLDFPRAQSPPNINASI